jgi:hypothetical protein
MIVVHYQQEQRDADDAPSVVLASDHWFTGILNKLKIK